MDALVTITIEWVEAATSKGSEGLDVVPSENPKDHDLR
jgi:hypothetical protein